MSVSVSVSVNVKVRLATPDDNRQLRRLAWRTAMGGKVRLMRAAVVEPWIDTFVAEEEGRIVGCGQRVRHERYINGKLTPTAYLSTLRVDPAASCPGRVIRDGYEFLGELHRADPRPTFTSVMSDNAAALRLLTRPRRSLPRYAFMTDYLTAILPGGALGQVEPQARWDEPRNFGDGLNVLCGPVMPTWEVAWRWLPIRRRVCIVAEGPLARSDPAMLQPVPFGRVAFGGPAGDPFMQQFRRIPKAYLLESKLFAVRWPGDDWELDDRPVWPEVADL